MQAQKLVPRSQHSGQVADHGGFQPGHLREYPAGPQAATHLFIERGDQPGREAAYHAVVSVIIRLDFSGDYAVCLRGSEYIGVGIQTFDVAAARKF